MDQAKYLEMVKRNPYTLEHIENPSEDIMLEAVRFSTSKPRRLT